VTRGDGVILVVDDDDDTREAMEIVLTDEGYRVELASGGHGALAYLRAHAAPSLILLDLMMPEMDGYEFRSRQVGDPAIAHIPVVVATGSGSGHLRESELHGALILHKPLVLEALIAAIERHRIH